MARYYKLNVVRQDNMKPLLTGLRVSLSGLHDTRCQYTDRPSYITAADKITLPISDARFAIHDDHRM